MPPDLRLLMSKPNWPSSDIARVFQGEYDPGVLVNFRSLNRAEKVNLLIALGFMYDRQSNNISHYRIAEILKMAADDGDKTVSFLGVIIGKYLLCGIEPKEQSFVTMLQEHLSFDIIKEADGLLDAWVQDLGIQRALHANDASFIHPLEAPYAPMRHLQQNVASLNPHFSCDLSKLKFRLEGQARIKKLYGEQDAPPKTPSSVHTTSKPSLQRRTSTSAAGSTSGQNPQKHQQAPIAPPSRKQAPPTQSGLRPSSSSLFVKRNTHATSTSYARPVERRSMVKHPNGARTQKISFSEVTEFNQSISENHDRALEERRQERLRQAEITKRRRTLEAQEAREAKRAAKLRR